MTGILAISGSDCTRFRKVVMACTPSSKASSIFTSSTCAPLSTCCLATLNASSYLSSLISLANFLLPVTLVRSPTLTKLVSGRTTKGSKPLSRKYGLICFVSFIILFFVFYHRVKGGIHRGKGVFADVMFCFDHILFCFLPQR